MKESKWEYMSVPQAQKYFRLIIAVCLLPDPSFSDIKMVIVFAVDITLDPATAHPSLFLSEGNRRVTWAEKSQDLPEDPQRFYSLPCVLGHQVITSGRWYWEVKVGSHGAWDLGICRPHVMRKGRVCIKPEDGFWALRFYKEEYWALTSPETKLR